MHKNIESFVNGGRLESSTEDGANIYNPATGKVSGITRFVSSAQIDDCVNLAKSSFGDWSLTSPITRARMLFRFNDLLARNCEQLAELISAENGKTHEDALGEVTRGREVVEFACGIPHLLKGGYSESVGSEVDTHSVRQPLGVVAGVTPFNFPAMVPMWMFPIAIACGNAFILKPSEKVPSSSLLLAELLTQAGCPPGVFNVLQGDRQVVDALLEHQDIAGVSFVGSTPVAKHIYSHGTNNGKRVQALGGAKNHMIVSPDADLDAAASALMGAAFGSAGQRCMAISVAVAIGDATADQLIKKLKPAVKNLIIGKADQQGVQMGPLISEEHRSKVIALIESGLSEGAELVVDGRKFEATGECANGFFLGGCLFDHVTPDMKIYQDEIFGPVLCLVRADSYHAAIDLVNNNEYGNGAAIFTQNGAMARHFSKHVLAGMVGINVPIPVPVAYHSFGGWKSSLFGDQHIYGQEGINFYTKLKTVTSRWTISDANQFIMPTLE